MATRTRPRRRARKKETPCGDVVEVIPGPPSGSAPVTAVLTGDRSDDEHPQLVARAVYLLGETSRHGAIAALRKEFDLGPAAAQRLLARAEEVILPQQPGAMEAFRANVLAQLDRLFVLATMQGDLRAAVAAVDRKARLLGLDAAPPPRAAHGAVTARPHRAPSPQAGEPLSDDEVAELAEFLRSNPVLALPEVS